MSRKAFSAQERGGFGRPFLLRPRQLHRSGQWFRIIGFYWILLAAGALADSGPDRYDELKSALHRCGEVATDEARLDCYDELLEIEFGANRTEMAEFIESTIARLERRPRGEYVFLLENGQTWTEVSPGRAHYRPGMEVRVERTTMGGYMLSTDSGRATRVRRIR
jgi:hypothetical protein